MIRPLTSNPVSCPSWLTPHSCPQVVSGIYCPDFLVKLGYAHLSFLRLISAIDCLAHVSIILFSFADWFHDREVSSSDGGCNNHTGVRPRDLYVKAGVLVIGDVYFGILKNELIDLFFIFFI